MLLFFHLCTISFLTLFSTECEVWTVHMAGFLKNRRSDQTEPLCLRTEASDRFRLPWWRIAERAAIFKASVETLEPAGTVKPLYSYSNRIHFPLFKGQHQTCSFYRLALGFRVRIEVVCTMSLKCSQRPKHLLMHPQSFFSGFSGSTRHVLFTSLCRWTIYKDQIQVMSCSRGVWIENEHQSEDQSSPPQDRVIQRASWPWRSGGVPGWRHRAPAGSSGGSGACGKKGRTARCPAWFQPERWASAACPAGCRGAGSPGWGGAGRRCWCPWPPTGTAGAGSPRSPKWWWPRSWGRGCLRRWTPRLQEVDVDVRVSCQYWMTTKQTAARNIQQSAQCVLICSWK